MIQVLQALLLQQLSLHLLSQQFGRILQVLSQSVGETTQTNRGEKVDGEPCIARIVCGEEATEHLLHVGIGEALLEGG